MQIGSAWTKTEQKEDGKKSVTGISVQFDDAIKELYPELKNVRFVLKPIPQEQRQAEKAPHWRFVMYKPQEQTSASGDSSAVTDEEIPF